MMKIQNSQDLSIEFQKNGTLYRIQRQNISINLFPGNALEAGPTNIYLRRHEGTTVRICPLLGPDSLNSFTGSSADVTDRCLSGSGCWSNLRYTLSIRLAESHPAWFWHIAVENQAAEPVICDVIYTQDIALADYGMVRLNEYYVSQYVDHQPLTHPDAGILVASRQNLAMGGKHPWILIGSLNKACSFATDASQVYGREHLLLKHTNCLEGDLPGVRLQHEHSMVALQDQKVTIQSGEKLNLGFYIWFEENHLDASSESDLEYHTKALSLPEASRYAVLDAGAEARTPAARSLFSSSPYLETLELSQSEQTTLFGNAEGIIERDAAGKILSFFSTNGEHVVYKAKEQSVTRPHGMILRTGTTVSPDESSLTSTVWMTGVFNSMLTQGHVSINRLLSTTHSYLGLFCSHGQRVFVEFAGKWLQLGTPSAFAMAVDGCRWIYKFEGGQIQINNTIGTPSHRFELDIEVLSGSPRRFLISNHIALGGDDGSTPQQVQFSRDEFGIFVSAPADSDVGRRFPEGGFRIDFNHDQIEHIGQDEMLFEDAQSRNQPFLCLLSPSVTTLRLSTTGHLIDASESSTSGDGNGRSWKELTLDLQFFPPKQSSLRERMQEIAAILPWYVQNALVHYLSPRGLEQYSGGGWGTRDVVQGPLEMLLSLNQGDAARDILLRVFKTQNEDGDWPQWFMFFERERNIRPGDSHGDIVLWPLLALGEYLLFSGDETLLHEVLPYFHPEGEKKAESETLLKHVDRALALISSRLISGTELISYGNGDWNDSLQPFDENLKKELISSWTVTLHYQTLCTLAKALKRTGFEEKSIELESTASAVLKDFKQHLIVDKTICGFLRTGETPSYLIHPRDRDTGLSYSILPYIHGILSNMLSKEEAVYHLQLIKKHLLGIDGARLFDKPLPYRGGKQKYFQRAESSSFFGREIGLMYTHAHLRYAQALAHLGEAELFFDALSLANPISLTRMVASAAPRQWNCYYSSSDAAFTDRYQAFAEYDKVRSGKIEFEGGWRVYSSGGGIYSGLLLSTFLGIRRQSDHLLLDPVIPKALDGLRVQLDWEGRPLEIVYHVESKGAGPARLILNDQPLAREQEFNPYRTGGALVSLLELKDALLGNDCLNIYLE